MGGASSKAAKRAVGAAPVKKVVEEGADESFAWMQEMVKRHGALESMRSGSAVHGSPTDGQQGRTVVVRARHILVDTKQEAEAALRELEAGRPFAEVAMQRSKSPSKHKGGVVGWLEGASRDEADPAEALQQPQIVPSKTGWHVVSLEVGAETDPIRENFGDAEEDVKRLAAAITSKPWEYTSMPALAPGALRPSSGRKVITSGDRSEKLNVLEEIEGRINVQQAAELFDLYYSEKNPQSTEDLAERFNLDPRKVGLLLEYFDRGQLRSTGHMKLRIPNAEKTKFDKNYVLTPQFQKAAEQFRQEKAKEDVEKDVEKGHEQAAV